MSKELTRAWKAGKLKNGWYFCKVLIDNKNHVCPVFVSKNENDFEIGEVLAACDYNQFVELTEKVKELEKEIERKQRFINARTSPVYREETYRLQKASIDELTSLLKECKDAYQIYIPLFKLLKNEEAVKTAVNLANKIGEVIDE